MKVIYKIMIVTLVLLGTKKAVAQTFQQAADQYLSGLVKEGKFSGAVLVAQNGTILLSKGYGYANQDTKVLNTPASVFRIGSITKPFVSVLTMQLVEQQKISLDLPISTYLPQVDSKIMAVTIRQLLQQTSGIENYSDAKLACEGFSQHPIQPLEFLDCIQELKVEFSPGTKFSYSNTNYYLLGIILEKVTGLSFEQLLQKQILHPLKLKHTGYTTRAIKTVQGYANEEGKLEPVAISDINRAYAAGGMYSTVQDLYAFEQALHSEKLLKKSSLTQIFAENKSVEPSYYGFGWYVGPDRIFHEGGIRGFSSCMDRDLNKNISVVVLSNYEFTESRTDVTEPLTKLLLTKEEKNVSK